MSLGARLKELRIQKNKSLQEVADAIGISKAHLWEIERGGSKNPSMETLTSLAKYFHTSVASLVGEKPSEVDEPELFAMYRDLKDLSARDRETIRMLMQRLSEETKGKK